MMKTYCPVLGCTTVYHENSSKFCPFPRDSTRFGNLSKLWFTFTRVNGYKSTSMPFCDRHFSSDRFRVLPNGNKVVRQGSVPTIYYSKDGNKSILTYDRLTRRYVGKQSAHLKPEGKIAYSKETLIAQRLEEVTKLKSICRMCFTKSSGKCVSFRRLENFGINPMKLLSQLDLNMNHQKAFSELICESCFIKIIEFEKFRNQCLANQLKIEKELNELDAKIREKTEPFDNYFGDEEEPVTTINSWFDIEARLAVNETVDEQNFREISSKITKIERGLKVLTDLRVSNEELIKSEAENTLQEMEIEIIDEIETLVEDDGDVQMDNFEDFIDEDYQNSPEPQVDTLEMPIDAQFTDNEDEFFNIEPIEIKSEVQPRPVTKELRRDYRNRTFECFYCDEKVDGRKNFQAHNCKIKTRPCIAEGCEKVFKNQSGFNSHITKVHKLVKITQIYCPCCRVFMYLSTADFHDHALRCLSEHENYTERKIECGRCKDMCDDLESYAQHLLMHDMQRKPSRKSRGGEKQREICDLCGMTFSKYNHLRRHRENVHLVGFTGRMLICDYCGLETKTRLKIRQHINEHHKIEWSECTVCQKRYETRRKMIKHRTKTHFMSKSKENKKFACGIELCNLRYATVKGLENHRANIHGIVSCYSI